MALPPEREPRRNELLLKLFFGANAEKKEVIQQLKIQLQKSVKARAQLTIIDIDVLSEVPENNPHKQFWQMTLRNGIALYDAEIRWLKESLQFLENKNKEN
jgi:hypothetical protein